MSELHVMVLGVPQFVDNTMLGVGPLKLPKQWPPVSKPVRVMEPVDATPFVMLPDAHVKSGGPEIVHIPNQGAVKPFCVAVKVIFAGNPIVAQLITISGPL